MNFFTVILTLCTFVGDVPVKCDKHSSKVHGMMLPYTCMMSGYDLAKHKLRKGQYVKRIRCIPPEKDLKR